MSCVTSFENSQGPEVQAPRFSDYSGQEMGRCIWKQVNEGERRERSCFCFYCQFLNRSCFFLMQRKKMQNTAAQETGENSMIKMR